MQATLRSPWSSAHTARFALVALVIALGACRGGDLPNLQGRYQGTLDRGTGAEQVVSQVSPFEGTGRERKLEIEVYRTLGTARGNHVAVRVVDAERMELTTDLHPSGPLWLGRSGDCASGALDGTDAKVCWGDGKIEMAVGPVSLKINRDDTLPPLENRIGVGRAYTLDELVGRARFLNYTVSQEAERVYQAREEIKAARGNLLPRLNLKAVVGVFTGDYVGAVGTVLPFLFPSNWYRWKASKSMYQAERKSFASLRGNEMSAVEGLFYVVLRDQAVLSMVRRHVAWMKRTQEGIRVEEGVGALPTGSAEEFGARVALLERDRVLLESLVKTQLGMLSQAVALPPLNGVAALSGGELPELTGIDPVNPAEFYRDAQTKSYEILGLQALLEAAKSTQKETVFGFLDPEGGGALGFGTPAEIRVHKSRQHEIRKRIEETYALVELKCGQVSVEYNSALEAYGVAGAGLAATQRRLDRLVYQHLTGDHELDESGFVDQLAELQFRVLELTADRLSAAQSWLMAKAKIQRLLLGGFYQDLEAALPAALEQ